MFSLQNTVSAPLQEHILQLGLLRSLGAFKKQLIWTISFQITLMAILSSVIGSLLIMAGLAFLPGLQAIIIGGMIVDPTFEPIHILLVVIGVSFPVLMTSAKIIRDFFQNHQD